jgi:hypothetical protein
MCTCVAPRKLLIKALMERFEKYPQQIPLGVPQPAEPGKRDENFNLKKRKLVKFKTKEPIIIFNHYDSIGGRRKLSGIETVKTLHPWGDALQLWNEFNS